MRLPFGRSRNHNDDEPLSVSKPLVLYSAYW